MVTILIIWMAYGIGQPHRHFIAIEWAPKAKVRKDCRLVISVVQETQSKNIKHQPERAPSEKQQHLRLFFYLGYVCVPVFGGQWNLQLYDSLVK